jgi:hypothetical protein
VGFFAVLLAVGLAILPAQEPFPPASPNGYVPNGQSPNGYNPITGYQRSVVPFQPAETSRPDTFPGGPTPPITPAAGNAPAYGPTYQPGQQQVPGHATQASFVGQPYPPGGAMPRMPLAPAELCEGAQILGRVGNDVVLTSDVLTGIDDMMSRAKGRIPPEKFAEKRAELVLEVTAGIAEFNAHYKDPDPAKSMSPSRRGLVNQLLQQQIDVKMIFQDFRANVPKEAIPSIQESVARHFDESQLKVLMKRENVVSRADLETALRAKGSSLEREKRIFMEQVVAQQWVQQKVKPEGEDKTEVTHEEMLKWYQAHIKDFEQPAKARWEELMVSFARHPNHDEAYAVMAGLGNRVLAGAALADVAKSASDGPTARLGGQRDWTHKGGLSSEALDQALFSSPVGQLSQILESASGYHIIRVVERQELTRKSFLDAQKEIKENIKKERFEERYQDFVKELHRKYPVWTVFDNMQQVPKNPDDDDRYSKQ